MFNTELEPNIAIVDTLWDSVTNTHFYFTCDVSAALLLFER